MSALTVEGGDAFFARIADAASEYFALQGAAQIELVFDSEEEIRALNRDSRGVDAATDVLSFPALTLTAGQYPPFESAVFPFDVDPENGAVDLGSIAVCEQVAARQAEEYGHSVRREKGYLFLHGVLHLLGFDHMTEADKAAMRRAEEEILRKVGLERES